MPSAYELAKELYCRQNKYTLDNDIAHYCEHHYAYCSPECIILAEILTEDTWFIYLAVGRNALARFVTMAPFTLPYVSFIRPEKRDKQKIYSFERIKRLCLQQSTNNSRNILCADSAGLKLHQLLNLH